MTSRTHAEPDQIRTKFARSRKASRDNLMNSEDAPFTMRVEHVVDLSGRGVLVGGLATAGRFPAIPGRARILRDGAEPLIAEIGGVEFGPRWPRIGVLLEGISSRDIPAGSVVAVGSRPAQGGDSTP